MFLIRAYRKKVMPYMVQMRKKTVYHLQMCWDTTRFSIKYKKKSTPSPHIQGVPKIMMAVDIQTSTPTLNWEGGTGHVI